MAKPNLSIAELNERRRLSGNLGGRPPRKPTVAQAEAKRLEELVPKALIRLERNIDAENDSVSQRAVDSVLDRAWGKPVQAIRAEVTEAVLPWQSWTPEQVAFVRGELQRRLALEAAVPVGNGPDAA